VATVSVTKSHGSVTLVTASAILATVLGSVPASSDTVKSGGQQTKYCWKKKNLDDFLIIDVPVLYLF
jgi:hypothetical protein